MKKYNVLGIGAACIDLMINVSDGFLREIPGTKGGAQPIERHELDYILTLSGQTPLITTGGSAANVIKCLAGLGESCAFFSSIGQDEFGKHFDQYFAKQGIQNFLTPSSNPTCCVLCMITPDGQRTMRFYEGSSQCISPEFLHPEYFDCLKLLHIDAYSLRRPGLVEKAMQQAKQKNVLISIDLSSFEIVQKYAEEIKVLLSKYADIIFANADETRALTALAPFEGCMQLQKMGKIAVVMNGKEGCFIGHKDTIIHCPAIAVNVVDTTGAGDFFAAGFLYNYLRNQTLMNCARLGHLLGGSIVEVRGAELPKEKWQLLRPRIQDLCL